MNDHITKPIRVKEVFTIMAKWISTRGLETVSADANKPQTIDESESGLPDLPGIDKQQGLMSANGKAELYRKVLLMFRTNQAGFNEQFKSAQDLGDWQQMQRLAHSLKGVAGNIGALELQSLSLELEQACQNQSAEIDSIHAKTSFELNRVLSGLQQLETSSKQAGIKLNNEELGQKIVRFKSLLEDSDVSANYALAELKVAELSPQNRQIVSDIESALLNYNFDEALANLLALEKQITG